MSTFRHVFQQCARLCEPYWPAFREIGFLRALSSLAARQRRFGR
jgi:undecaprenyl pyrophosphate synthase